jgi:hypothetical protein
MWYLIFETETWFEIYSYLACVIDTRESWRDGRRRWWIGGGGGGSSSGGSGNPGRGNGVAV